MSAPPRQPNPSSIGPIGATVLSHAPLRSRLGIVGCPLGWSRTSTRQECRAASSPAPCAATQGADRAPPQHGAGPGEDQWFHLQGDLRPVQPAAQPLLNVSPFGSSATARHTGRPPWEEGLSTTGRSHIATQGHIARSSPRVAQDNSTRRTRVGRQTSPAITRPPDCWGCRSAPAQASSGQLRLRARRPCA